MVPDRRGPADSQASGEVWDAERNWQRVQEVLAEALELPADRRPAYLDQACGGEEALRREVESLIGAYDEAKSFIERPAFVLGEGGEPPAGPGVPVGERVGPYRVVELLGEGGMGTVYRGLRDDGSYRAQVAIKVLQRGMYSDALVRRFRDERQILANLDHPSIAKLVDGGSLDDGRPYLVMEYVRGEPIDLWAAGRGLDVRGRLELFIKVCRAVHFAHQNLVVHRDLKPANILVTEHGEPKLLDFGIAKLLDLETRQSGRTTPGMIPMTPEYASPEQVRGELITTASDVYSLGVLLFELLTGCRPYRVTGRPAPEVIEIVSGREPRRPSTVVAEMAERVERPTTLASTVAGTDPEAAASRFETARVAVPNAVADLRQRLAGDLDHIVLKALRKEPHRRYSSAAQLAADLTNHLEGRPVSARKGTLAYRAGKFVRRHRAAVAAAATVLVLLLGFLATLLVQRQRILRERNRAEVVSDFLVDLFENADPEEGSGRKVPVQEILLRGSREIAGRLDQQPEIKADLLETMARVYYHQGLFAEAVPLLEEALELRRQAGERIIEARNLALMAQLREAQGELKVAEELHRQALEMRRELLGAQHQETARSTYLLGVNQHLQSNYEAAAQLHAEALGLLERTSEGPHPHVAASLNALAAVQREQGDYGQAEELYRRALAMQLRLHGEDHPATTVALNNLANILRLTGQTRESEELFRRALEAEEAVFEDEPHPYIATTLYNLAALMQEEGDDQQAAELLDRALEIRRQVYGDDHPRVGRTLNRLAELQFRAGDYPAAEVSFRELLAMRRRQLGDDHPDTAAACSNLGQALAKMGDREGAEELYREARAILERRYGSDHPRVAAICNNMAVVAKEAGDYEQAEALYRQALAIVRPAVGDDHHLVAIYLNNLGSMLEDQGSHERAEPLLEEALAIMRGRFGEEHRNTAVVMKNLAATQLGLGQHDQAEETIRRALAIYATTLPPEHEWTLDAQVVLARTLAGQGDRRQAERLLRTAYGTLLRNLGDQATATVDAREALAALYEEWGQAERAAAVRRGEAARLVLATP